MRPVNALIVDTSVWIEFFRGRSIPDLEVALREGMVVLSPLVCAELLSGALNQTARHKLADFLSDLPLHPTPFEHWVDVGALRSRLAGRALTVSTPDAHVAQCALDLDARLWSRDRVFRAMAKHTELRLFE